MSTDSRKLGSPDTVIVFIRKATQEQECCLEPADTTSCDDLPERVKCELSKRLCLFRPSYLIYQDHTLYLDAQGLCHFTQSYICVKGTSIVSNLSFLDLPKLCHTYSSLQLNNFFRNPQKLGISLIWSTLGIISK